MVRPVRSLAVETAGIDFSPEWRARAAERMARFDRRAVAVPEGHRAAAIAACLVPDDQGRACFLLTRRAAGLRTHARQWAMPGGRLDGSENAIDAPRREMHEEMFRAVALHGLRPVIDRSFSFDEGRQATKGLDY